MPATAKCRCSAVSVSPSTTGEIVAILGANGAGKTTTLRAISGTVRADRQDSSSPDSRSRAAVPESTARLGSGARAGGARHVRRVDRLGEPAARRDRPPWLAPRRLRARARILPVARTAPVRQQAGTLSGGEQQMLALARAVMQRPKLLLLDEPSLGLAPLVIAEIFRIVRELNEREGTAVLLVEQNARTSLATASRAYVLEVGRRRVRRVRAKSSRRATRSAGATWATDGALSINDSARCAARPPAGSSRRRIVAGCVVPARSARCGARCSRSRRSPASRTAASTRASRSRSSSSTARPR